MRMQMRIGMILLLILIGMMSSLPAQIVQRIYGFPDPIARIDSTIDHGNWTFGYDAESRLISKESHPKNEYDDAHFKLYNYDSLGTLQARGKAIASRYRKTGTWKYFDAQHHLVKVERYRDGRLHGQCRYVSEHYSMRFKYGLGGLDLYNAEGRRMVFLFTYGLPRFWDNSKNIDQFACYEFPIAGCVVNREILWRAGVHNIFVGLHQTLRFGPHWKRDYFDFERHRKPLPDSLQL